MRILAAVDGSSQSLRALDALLARLAWFREQPAIDLIYVHPKVPYGAAAAWTGKEAVQEYYDEESEAALAPARERLAPLGVLNIALKKVGDPAEEIVRAAAGYDLIAMGTHGRGALATLVLGSTASKVLETTEVPVLLLK